MRRNNNKTLDGCERNGALELLLAAKKRRKQKRKEKKKKKAANQATHSPHSAIFRHNGQHVPTRMAV
jgi:hypothetical protein